MLFLFDSHSKDETGRMSAAGTAVCLKFDSLQSLEIYIKLLPDGSLLPSTIFKTKIH